MRQVAFVVMIAAVALTALTAGCDNTPTQPSARRRRAFSCRDESHRYWGAWLGRARTVRAVHGDGASH